VVQTVYAMCGLAFSGKSSVAAILTRDLEAQLISLDAINDERGLRGGEGMSDRQWEETSAIAMDRLGALLQAAPLSWTTPFRIAFYATDASTWRATMAAVS